MHFLVLNVCATYILYGFKILAILTIENNRKTGENVIFSNIDRIRTLNAVNKPFHGLMMICWTSGDILKWFSKFSRPRGGSAGGRYRVNWAVLSHFEPFQRENDTKWRHNQHLNTITGCQDTIWDPGITIKWF